MSEFSQSDLVVVELLFAHKIEQFAHFLQFEKSQFLLKFLEQLSESLLILLESDFYFFAQQLLTFRGFGFRDWVLTHFFGNEGSSRGGFLEKILVTRDFVDELGNSFGGSFGGRCFGLDCNDEFGEGLLHEI